MEKEEFYQQAVLMALNGLLSNGAQRLEEEYLENHATVAAMAHLYAKAVTDRTFIEQTKI
jgi:hypothetical protein